MSCCGLIEVLYGLRLEASAFPKSKKRKECLNCSHVPKRRGAAFCDQCGERLEEVYCDPDARLLTEFFGGEGTMLVPCAGLVGRKENWSDNVFYVGVDLGDDAGRLEVDEAPSLDLTATQALLPADADARLSKFIKRFNLKVEFAPRWWLLHRYI